MRRFLGWAGIVLALVLILVPAAALTFSVQVNGKSMEPTLHTGDRLFVAFWARGDVHRFDLVEAEFQVSGNNGTARAVKRVIGMPGDVISVSYDDKGEALVSLQPAGDATAYLVHNPAWVGRVGSKTSPCCRPDGVRTDKPTTMTVPDGSYWLVGDNWGESDDSRTYGVVTTDKIFGRLNFRLLPLGKLGTVAHDVELVPAKP